MPKESARELKGRLTVAEIINRIDDGRPGPDAAWALVPRDEETTVVWTREIALASGAAQPLLDEGDKAGAARAFRERYIELVAAARTRHEPPTWEVCLGWDPFGRQGPIEEAIELGRITDDYRAHLPVERPDAPRIGAPTQDIKAIIAESLATPRTRGAD